MVYEICRNISTEELFATAFLNKPQSKKSPRPAVRSFSGSASEAVRAQPELKKKSKPQQEKPDAWGPIFKNREHFVEMHNF